MAGERFYEAPAERGRRSAPAALRNREPIAEVLREWLPQPGLVLEIASGTGEHAVYFAKRFPASGMAAKRHSRRCAELDRSMARRSRPRQPARTDHLDAAATEWPIDHADAVLSINMVHISPWTSALGLIAGAAGCFNQASR